MAVVHPRLERWEFEALQEQLGWEAPMEYLDGQAVVTPPPGEIHQVRLFDLGVRLREWQRTTGDEGWFTLDTLVLIGGDQLAPDLSYWNAGRRRERVPGRVDVTPDLIVEIASPSTRANDRGPKRAAYFAAGVREQWLIDPVEGRMVFIDVRNRETALAAEDTLSSAVLTGFSAPVSTLIGR